jgi:hypothetical protein
MTEPTGQIAPLRAAKNSRGKAGDRVRQAGSAPEHRQRDAGTYIPGQNARPGRREF